MKKSRISIKGISNPKLDENIKLLEGKIRQFFDLVSNETKDAEWGDMSVIAEVGDHYAYADDGNTQVPGKEYEFYWIKPFKGNVREGVTTYCLSEGLEYNTLYFKYRVCERVSDGKLWSPFVTLYYCRDRKVCFDTDATSRGYHTCSSNFLKIDHNNDNYELTSVINIKNAVECIELISRDVKRMKLIDLLEAENSISGEGCIPVNSSIL